MIRRRGLSGLGAVALVLAVVPGLVACQAPAQAETAVTVPPARVTASEQGTSKVALLAGGCYWGMEAVFSHIKGVHSVVSGFEGGSKANAHYERVSDGDTGHAESVRITYDPRVIRYDQLLQVFFSVASDPTQLNRQGPDTGTQYRNAIVPLSPEQARVAKAYLEQLRAANPWRRPIVTVLEPDRGFFPAEDYHQDFALKNPDHPYIRYWDVPKVAALQRAFPALWKPVFTAN